MTVRLKLGRFPDGTYRMRAVTAGGNVDGPINFGTLVFASELSMLPIVQSGDVALPNVTSNVQVNIPDLGYIPFVLAGYYCTDRTSGSRGLRSYESKIERDPTVWGDPYYVPFTQNGGDSPEWDNYVRLGPGTNNDAVRVQNRPCAMMGYTWAEDANNGDPNKERFGFVCFVRQTNVQFRRWCISPNAGGYAAKYYVFAIPI